MCTFIKSIRFFLLAAFLLKMKLTLLLVITIAAAAFAFPAGEADPMPTAMKSELNPEGKVADQMHALLAADANPEGDGKASDRAKRFVFVYSYPWAYSYPVVYI